MSSHLLISLKKRFNKLVPAPKSGARVLKVGQNNVCACFAKVIGMLLLMGIKIGSPKVYATSTLSTQTTIGVRVMHVAWV